MNQDPGEAHWRVVLRIFPCSRRGGRTSANFYDAVSRHNSKILANLEHGGAIYVSGRCYLIDTYMAKDWLGCLALDW